MVVSNEPGYYRDDCYGMRCENLVVVQASAAGSADGPAMLEFEVLTLVPFDRRLLDVTLLTPVEIAWLNDYHATVREQLAPQLTSAEQQWLQRAAQPLAAPAA